MKKNNSKKKLTASEYYDEVFDAVNGDIWDVACQLRVLHLALEGGETDTIPNKAMLPHIVLYSACRLEKAIERLNNLQ